MKILLICFTLAFIQISCQKIKAVPPQVKETRLNIEEPLITESAVLSISPDGDKIVFAAESKGKYQLWLYSLISKKSRPLSGTEGVTVPFSTCWSPDSRSIAFFNDGLIRLDIDTGQVENLTSSSLNLPLFEGRGCTWNRNGDILFSVDYYDRAIFRISDRGGAVSSATPPGPFKLMYPYFLPDGKHFLYYAQGNGIYVTQIDGSGATKLMDADTAAVYSNSGHLLFVRAGKLYAQKFDPKSMELSGAPFVVADQIPEVMSTATVSTSAVGHIIYGTGGAGNLRQFAWFDRKGNKKETVGEPLPLGVAAPDLSPDKQSIVFDGSQNGNMDLWILKLNSGEILRFTSDPAEDFFPVWSAEGKIIYFSSGRTGLNELYAKPVDESGPERRAMNDGNPRAPRSVSRDGRYLLSALTNTLTLDLKAVPRREMTFALNCVHPQFSPDGQWVAFQSHPTPDVYIQHFPNGQQMQISANGGGHVRWRSDGKELFYIDRDGNLVAVPITLGGDGKRITIGKTEVLFKPPLIADIVLSPFAQQYNVSEDGQRFLIAAVPKMKSHVIIIRGLE